MAARVLVVDDEPEIVGLIRFHLERAGYDVETAYDGAEALEKFEARPPDLVILDVMLPKHDGLEVCRRIRSRSDVPVILLTARSHEEDRVAGLDLGADDYVAKPFSVRELVARVRAQLRRYGGNARTVHRWRHVTLDEAGHRLLVGTREVPLTATEFALLAAMLRAPGRVFTREHLLEAVWGRDYFGDLRTVDVHIKHVREKLQEAGAPGMIETVRGVGYRIAQPS